MSKPETKPIPEFSIEQALFFHTRERGLFLSGKSSGYSEIDLGLTRQLLELFGTPPEGVFFHEIVFARPLGKQQVVVVQVGDLRGIEYPPGEIGFRVLLVPRKKYVRFLGDPFVLGDKFPPDWQAGINLQPLHWPQQPLPMRTVADVQKVLQRVKYAALKEDIPGEEQIEAEPDPADHSEGPALLGGVQILVDNGRIIFERQAPDPDLVRAMWTLLPESTRAEIWPTTFAFHNKVPFDLMVVPKYTKEEYPGYTTEDQAADYPEGRYELSLQIAAEANDQEGLNELYYRRSSRETMRLAIILLIGMTIAVSLSFLIRRSRPSPEVVRAEQAKIISGIAGMNNPLNAASYYNMVREPLNQLQKELP